MKFINTLFALILAFLITLAWASCVRSQPLNTNQEKGWPRTFTTSEGTLSVYQPQIESWTDNQLSARAAFSVTTSRTTQSSYGVVWFTTRTEIDKASRIVKLSNVTVTKINYPSSPQQTQVYRNVLQARVAEHVETIALDRLLADMAINQATTAMAAHDVKNDPPQVIFSTRPAILILVDGDPVFRRVDNTSLDRVINTHVLLLRDSANGTFYLRLLSGWMEAQNVTGPWQVSKSTSNDLKTALQIAKTKGGVDLLEGAGSKPAVALPDVYVSTSPAELLQSNGEPQVASIDNTELIYVVNTDNDIFLYLPTQDHFVLLAGRWFHAKSMNGPWEFVPSAKLPVDFAQIPENHPKASVLVSIPGTPQAREALIANSIPQTAVIKRSGATITVTYDGMPRFKKIENTSLEYAVNTITPVIKVDAQTFYAVQNAVWFVANTPLGPWTVATSIPSVVYSIPLSSPVHNVTYVKVYESTPEVVYVGYTPGYYGTVVTTANVIVYGSGWYYPPYIGTYWYAAPYTYGYAAASYWSAGYGWGVTTANVYGQWGNVAYSGTRAAWANAYTGNVGYAGAYSGVNTATGTRYVARGGTNTNVYTGTTVTGGGVAAYNPNTGRVAAGQAGTASNVYTGNSAAGARGATYNPQTGVISCGAVGGVRNGSTGQVDAGRSAFAYNPSTNTGAAIANNNVYATQNGDIYRYNPSSGVQQRVDGDWQSVQRQQDRSWVQNQNQARSLGQQRTQNFSSMRPNISSGSRPTVGGGGGRSFGGRRR